MAINNNLSAKIQLPHIHLIIFRIYVYMLGWELGTIPHHILHFEPLIEKPKKKNIFVLIMITSKS